MSTIGNETESIYTKPEIKEYILVPEFTNETTFFEFFIVLSGFLFLMVGYVYASNYNNNYTPNFSMFIDFLIDNNYESQRRFKRYIKDIANEPFTGLDLDNKDNISNVSNVNKSSFVDKIRFYINSFITNTFYVKKNTVHVKMI